MIPNDLAKLIKKRRSIRIFTGQKVSQTDLLKIIEAGIWAPSGCNNQELRFLILDKPKDLPEIGKFKPFFFGVSAYILVLCDMSLPKSPSLYSPKRVGRLLPYLDAGLALQNMALVAEGLGLGSCVFNLSEGHFSKPTKTSLGRKIVRYLKLKFKFKITSLDNNFEYVLRNRLKVPDHLKIIGTLAVGYTKYYPDIKTVMHGARPVMRKDINYYLVKR